MDSRSQLKLFDMEQVIAAYAKAEGAELDNSELYAAVQSSAGIDDAAMTRRDPVGIAAQPHNLVKRRIRWQQQTAKKLGLLERVPGHRCKWRLTQKALPKEGQAGAGVALIAFSTDLGIALWGSWQSVFPKLDEPIALVLTSPPYPLAKPRAYGNPSEPEYVDFICKAMEPLVRNLLPGGSIVLNISNDIFVPGLPARSLYQERLVLALHDRLGLYKMDTLIWHGSKPPGPVQWASKTRQQLNTAYEPIYWFTNDPARCFSDNRRVLEPHTDKRKRLVEQGGEKRHAVNSDGAYRIHPGSYGKQTAGRIPRNILAIGHRCKDALECNRYAREQGLPTHGAPMPLRLASTLVQFLTERGQLVVDPFGGRATTGKAAEDNGRRWLVTENRAEYLHAGAHRFRLVPSLGVAA